MTRSLLPLLLACLAGCAHAAPPPPPEIGAATFASVERVAQSMPRAAAPAVAGQKLGEQVKALAQAIASVKKQPLNAAEQPVLAEYEQALDAYQFSLDLQAEKARRQASTAGGDRVPVQIDTMKLTSLLDGATRYGLPLLDETLPNGVPLKVLPSDAPDRVWLAGDASLARASSLLPPAGTTR